MKKLGKNLVLFFAILIVFAFTLPLAGCYMMPPERPTTSITTIGD